MTSQIAIINGFGVALASDSAMSLGETRIYDTAEKMVPLPLPHRIAVMHAGRVRIGNLPYSVLVSEWARQLGNKALRSADAYAKSFQDWLSNNPQWFPVNPQQSDALNFIETRADAIVGHFQANREDDENFQFTELLSRWTSEVQELPRLEGMTAIAALATFEKHKEQIEELLNEYLAPVVGPDYPKDAFLNYCAEFFSSAWMTNATLTFTGYGEQEIYASYVSINFQGFVDGRLSWIKGDSYALSPETNPLMTICLPAQRDAIDQYLRGYDTQMIDEIIERSHHERYELLNSIREKFVGDDSLLEKIDKAAEETLAQFETQLPQTAHEYSERNYLVSLRRALAALPAASLVEVARSLIELQALRKTTTAQADTVGGPIDVALITPTDGFVWIRHKSIS